MKRWICRIMTILLAISMIGGVTSSQAFAAEKIYKSDLFYLYPNYLPKTNARITSAFKDADHAFNSISNHDKWIMIGESALSNPDGYTLGDLAAELGIGQTVEQKSTEEAAKALLEMLAQSPGIAKTVSKVNDRFKDLLEIIKTTSEWGEFMLSVSPADVDTKVIKDVVEDENVWLEEFGEFVDFVDTAQEMFEFAATVELCEAVQMDIMDFIIDNVDDQLAAPIIKYKNYIKTNYFSYIVEKYINEAAVEKILSLKSMIDVFDSSGAGISAAFSLVKATMGLIADREKEFTGVGSAEDFLVAAKLDRYATCLQTALADDHGKFITEPMLSDDIADYEMRYEIYAASVKAYVQSIKSVDNNYDSQMDAHLEELKDFSIDDHYDDVIAAIRAVDVSERKTLQDCPGYFYDFTTYDGMVTVTGPSDEIEPGKLYTANGKVHFSVLLKDGMDITCDVEMLDVSCSGGQAALTVDPDLTVSMGSLYSNSIAINGENTNIEVNGDASLTTFSMDGGTAEFNDAVITKNTYISSGSTIKLNTPYDKKVEMKGALYLSLDDGTDHGKAGMTLVTSETGMTATGKAPSHNMTSYIPMTFNSTGDEIGGISTQADMTINDPDSLLIRNYLGTSESEDVDLNVKSLKVQKDIIARGTTADNSIFRVPEGSEVTVDGSITLTDGLLDLAGKAEAGTVNATSVTISGEKALLKVNGTTAVTTFRMNGGTAEFNDAVSTKNTYISNGSTIRLNTPYDKKVEMKGALYLLLDDGTDRGNAGMTLVANESGMTATGKAPSHNMTSYIPMTFNSTGDEIGGISTQADMTINDPDSLVVRNYLGASESKDVDLNVKSLRVKKDMTARGTTADNSIFRVPEGSEVTVDGSVTLTDGLLDLAGKAEAGTVNATSVTISGEKALLKVNGTTAVTTFRMNGGTAEFAGNFSARNRTLSGLVIFSGTDKQNAPAGTYDTVILMNDSDEGVAFDSNITVNTLFDHNRKAYKLPGDGSGSVFADFDADGVKDNLDPYPRDPEISSIALIAEPVEDQTYTGEAITPEVVIKDEEGKILVKDKDYTIDYADNTEVGTASITVTGIGRYAIYLQTEATFNIVDAPDLSEAYAALEKAIAEAEEIALSDVAFTVESYTAFTVALDKAKEVVAKTDASYEELTAAADELIYAKNALEIQGDPNPEHIHVPVHCDKVDATCTSDGNVEYWYCEECGRLYSDEACENEISAVDVTIPSYGHDWNTPTYAWAPNNSTVTATMTCKNDPDGLHTVTETVKTTSEITKAATYTAMGQRTYTAIFTNNSFNTKTKVVTNVPKLAKKTNPITVKTKTNTVRYSILKKKSQTIAAKKAFTVSKAQGKITYKKASGNKKITISSSGRITVKKGLKRGTYKVKVIVKAAGTTSFKAGTKGVTLTIRVR